MSALFGPPFLPYLTGAFVVGVNMRTNRFGGTSADEIRSREKPQFDPLPVYPFGWTLLNCSPNWSQTAPSYSAGVKSFSTVSTMSLTSGRYESQS